MAHRSIKLPDVGEGTAEAEIVEWSVTVGDLIKEDQIIAAVMTDKATVEIPSPLAGTVVALGAPLGSTLAVGAELICLDVRDIDAPVTTQHHPPNTHQTFAESAPPSQTTSVARPEFVAASDRTIEQTAAKKSAPLSRPEQELAAPTRPLASPSVRRRARDLGIDLRQVRGTGPAGRISHKDLDAAQDLPNSNSPGRAANLAVTEQKVIGLRRRIAQNMPTPAAAFLIFLMLKRST